MVLLCWLHVKSVSTMIGVTVYLEKAWKSVRTWRLPYWVTGKSWPRVMGVDGCGHSQCVRVLGGPQWVCVCPAAVLGQGFLQSAALSTGQNHAQANAEFAWCSACSLICQLRWNKSVFSKQVRVVLTVLSVFISSCWAPYASVQFANRSYVARRKLLSLYLNTGIQIGNCFILLYNKHYFGILRFFYKGCINFIL